MHWASYKKGFEAFLKLERSLSTNSIDAYMADVEKFEQFLEASGANKSPNQVELDDFRDFLKWINELGLTATSQARIVSGLKAFYKYLLLEDIIKDDPTQLLEAPKTGRKLPDTLSDQEIGLMLDAVDRSKPEGERNRAVIETLYGCGLRVSELVNLQISNLFLKEGFIRVIGKGNKERLVPIGKMAVKQINIYKNEIRNHQLPQPGHEDFLFLNRRGKQLTRVMIFTIVKKLAEIAGIQKAISPHTLRHSFATELVKHGADLRAVQEMLGHESITTTEIYTHLDRNFLQETVMKHHPRS